jgi:hypothetical protein
VEYAQAFASTLHVMTVVPDFDMSVVGSFFPKEYEKKVLDLAMDQFHERAAANVPKEVTV